VLHNSDIELLEIMIDSLDKYLKAAGRLSDDAFNELSKHYGLLWMELTRQKEIIEGLLRTQNLEVKQDTKIEEDTAIEDTAIEDTAIEQNTVIKQDTPSISENAGVRLYDAMVDFLKQQKYIELHWVRVYAVKCPQEGFYDFQIKYFEHKDPSQAEKNYLLFGDSNTNYSMRKKYDEIIGDTSQCFEYILNLRDQLGIE